MIRDEIPPPMATRIPFFKTWRRLLASSAEDDTVVDGYTATLGGNVNAPVDVVSNARSVAALNGSIGSCEQWAKANLSEEPMGHETTAVTKDVGVLRAF